MAPEICLKSDIFHRYVILFLLVTKYECSITKWTKISERKEKKQIGITSCFIFSYTMLSLLYYIYQKYSYADIATVDSSSFWFPRLNLQIFLWSQHLFQPPFPTASPLCAISNRSSYTLTFNIGCTITTPCPFFDAFSHDSW